MIPKMGTWELIKIEILTNFHSKFIETFLKINLNKY